MSIRWLAALPLALSAACADRAALPAVAPEGEAPPAMQRVTCVARPAALDVRCDGPVGGAARGDLLLGGQGTYVRLASASPSYVDGRFTFFITVQNLLGQAIGTTDGTNVASTGVRVFFPSAPVTTVGSGTATVVGDGTATFTAGNQPYYQYSQVVAPGATSAPRRWRIDMPATVTEFTFTLYVSAPVRYPDGWVDLGASASTVPTGTPVTLSPVVRDKFGNPVAGQTVTFQSSAPAVATVDASGVVTPVSTGSATITANSGALTGSLSLTVAKRVASLLLFPNPSNVLVGATQQTTLILRDSAGNNLSATGRVVAWSSSDTTRVKVGPTGIITAMAPGSATLGVSVEGISGQQTVNVNTAPAGIVQMAQLAAGANHTCGLSTTGAAYCWGPNMYGQLGNGQIGTTAAFYRNTPSAVSGGLTFTSISSGGGRSCALTAAGAAYCWGNNDFGPLGKGDTVHAEVPTLVSGGITWSRLVTSRELTCGIDTSGQAWCWGHNNLGQLGTGGGDSYVPAQVAGGHTFVEISSSWDHVCALTGGGDVYCWGGNLRGALGDGTFTDRATPVKVLGGITFASISMGMLYSCGVSTSGKAYCWGDNSFSTLGNGGATSPESSPVPVEVSGGMTWSRMAAGARFATCGITTNGNAYCWGRNDGAMLLGAGSIGSSTVPARVTGGVAFASLSAGAIQTCGVSTSGYAYCWGPAVTGALGDGTYTGRASPTPVAKGQVP